MKKTWIKINKTSLLVKLIFLWFLGPNIADITKQYQKIVKPFVEKPFIPTEVDKLQDMSKKTYTDIQMTNAILIGPKEQGSGPEVNNIPGKFFKNYCFYS